MPDRRTRQRQPALLPVRTAIILLLALVIAAVVAGLTWLARKSPAEAALAGLAASASTVTFFDRHLDRS
jgi:hypothetical protein